MTELEAMEQRALELHHVIEKATGVLDEAAKHSPTDVYDWVTNYVRAAHQALDELRRVL